MRRRMSAKERKLRAELRYYQQQYRVDLFSLRAGKAKMIEIAGKIRKEKNAGIR